MNASEKFLRNYNMYYEQTDFDSLVKMHEQEMKKAVSGESSSLRCIPSECIIGNGRKKIQKAVAVDSGGTNLRVALVSLEKKAPETEKMEKLVLPFSGEEADSDEFFSFIAEKLRYYIGESKYVGISCAYNSVINQDRDAVIDALGKEMKVRDIRGKHFAREVKKHLGSLGNDVEMVCLNDTAASLLGSVSDEQINSGAFCCGLVVGTGMNTCYLQPEKGVLSSLEKKRDIIVTEAAFFDKANAGIIDEAVDLKSAVPKDHVYEKMIGGKYLPEIFCESMRRALEDGYISEEKYLRDKIDGKYLDELLSSSAENKDGVFAKEVLRNIVRRAGMLAAANIAAYVHLSGASKAFIACEGTTINKLAGFRESFCNYLNEWLVNKHDVSFELLSCEDCVIKGAAKAVLL